jgi:ElaB/YqjD/DUF883 family membrane-anchored ribosome-binding protein
MSPEERGPEEKAVNAADPTPAEIRAEIEETREELGDTVEALAEKTDVKAQAKAKVEDVKGQAKSKVEDVKAKAKEAAPESPQQGVQQAQAFAKENPKPVAIAAGVFVLFVLWRLLRS